MVTMVLAVMMGFEVDWGSLLGGMQPWARRSVEVVAFCGAERCRESLAKGQGFNQ